MELDLHLDAIVIPVPKASLLGIISNEIVTNSITHGFPVPGLCQLVVNCFIDREILTISLGDNGIGCDIFQLPNPGIGTQLISLLVEQLNGTVGVSVEKGTVFNIKLPL